MWKRVLKSGKGEKLINFRKCDIKNVDNFFGGKNEIWKIIQQISGRELKKY